MSLWFTIASCILKTQQDKTPANVPVLFYCVSILHNIHNNWEGGAKTVLYSPAYMHPREH